MSLRIKPLYVLIFPLCFLLLSSCGKDEKKEIRQKWFEYFFAFVDAPQIGLGTDSLTVNFQNHSPYKVDSVGMIFHNNGLFVNSRDTLYAYNIPAGGNVKVPVPHHTLGVSHKVEIYFIRSKDLDFCFLQQATKDGGEEDPYKCK